MGHEYILVEGSCDARAALVNAAPSSDGMLVCARNICLESFSHFSHNEHLLVLHQSFSFMVLHDTLDVILYLTLRFLMHFVTHELET
jgi:hypothetical protein